MSIVTEEQHNSSPFWFGFFLGGFFGAFITLALGNKKGKELAHLITEKVEIEEENVEQQVTKLQEKAEALLKEAQHVSNKVTSEVEQKKTSLTEELANKMDKAFSAIESVHHRFFKKNGKKLTS